MGEVQMLFPMEPKEFWQKLKTIVEQVLIEHSSHGPLLNAPDKNGQRPLLKASEVCAIFKISKPTLYEWMSQGKPPSIKIESRRFFRREDVEKLIESSRITGVKNTILSPPPQLRYVANFGRNLIKLKMFKQVRQPLTHPSKLPLYAVSKMYVCRTNGHLALHSELVSGNMAVDQVISNSDSKRS